MTDNKQVITLTFKGTSDAFKNLYDTGIVSPRGDNGKMKTGKLELVSKNEISNVKNVPNNSNIDSINSFKNDMIDIGIAVAGTVVTTIGAIVMDELVVPKVKKLWKNNIKPFFIGTRPSNKIMSISYTPQTLSNEIDEVKNKFDNNISEEEARQRLKLIIFCSLVIAKNREKLKNSNIVFNESFAKLLDDKLIDEYNKSLTENDYILLADEVGLKLDSNGLTKKELTDRLLVKKDSL